MKGWTPENTDELRRRKPHLFDNIEWARHIAEKVFSGAAGGMVSNPKRQPDSIDEPVAEIPRETPRQVRSRIRITSFRVRSTDDDNIQLGAKPLVDALVDAGIIPSDSKIWAKIEYEERLVDHRALERTEIEITQLS